eukprot:CAMPEP_0194089348 /NCGR_PEP_ID=MMETSP0149-20130528/33879_1 /TAXON_ID=122233 /ORGANISM="Chaetoceros debilis, Strain MM31A-1" /LENGTH=165 /DNA_ID=CAMNT_0038773245 /DNA_START=12 /DNA_END=509 /DNA_ORIENTATION=-
MSFRRTIFLLVTIISSWTNAFTIPSNARQIRSSVATKPRLPLLHASGKEPILSSRGLETDVRERIMSLSLLKSDEERRMELSNLLENNLLNRNNDDASQFALLWDAALIEIGSDVQTKAKARAEAEAGSGEVVGNEEDKQQLWALVDMMVQSKSLIKKMTGEAFQ